MALAYMMTGTLDEAEDVVQDVLGRLLSANLDTIDDLRSYARRAITNECASRVAGADVASSATGHWNPNGSDSTPHNQIPTAALK